MLKHYRGYTIWLLLIISRDTMTNDRTKINIAELFSNSAPLKISAPMVRYSKLSFRRLLRLYGCQLCFTPMIYAKCFIQSEKARRADFSTDASDLPLIVQFAADNCDDFVKAAEIVYTQCDGVDLNCGCPKRKTLDANCGSALLDNASHLAELIKQSRLRILDSKFSISVKIRIYENLKDTVDLCQKLQSAGITFINVHGRTVEQRHEPVDVEVFKVIKDSLQIPVVANGDVRSLSDVHYYHQHAGVEGVMVARALLENPALFTGADKTPADCFFHWMKFAEADNVPFTRFHRHISFMLEKSLNKSQRAELAEIRDSNQLFTFVSKTVALALLNFGVPLSIPRKLLSVHLFQDCNIISIFLQPNFLQPSIDMACVGVLSNCFFTSSSLILLISISSNVVETVKISGRWHHGSGDPLLTLLAGFGFQKTDPADLEATRGFIFGNITDGMAKPAGYLILIASDWIEEMKTVYRSDNASCKQLMSRLSDLAFERRCFPKNGQDFFRSIPCPVGNICPDEDDRTNVISGYQLTFRIQDVIQARFWYLALVNCILDDACNWVPFNSTIDLQYELWLVNGHPSRRNRNPLEHQFSVEQQDTLELYLFACCIFIGLFGAHLYSISSGRFRSHRSSVAMLLLVGLQVLYYSVRCGHCIAIVVGGVSIVPLLHVGDLLFSLADVLFALLLVHFATSWPKSFQHFPAKRKLTTIFGPLALTAQLTLTICATMSRVELLPNHFVETWPGWLILALRLLLMKWFLTELRISLQRERDSSDRSKFLLHFGSGYMVWFIYLVALGALVGEFSVLWRYKVLNGICFFANFVAYAAMVHLFWPQSVLQKLLCSNDDFDSSKDSADWDEYEQAIIISSSDR
ncbi:tRNA-dihydrouridine(20a/20b) synthase [NAD(P)+]-like [Trichinella spiralis]|uniref:tRNA-dihydrouridine(20a/20b) synthase [NAD(P)+]-like n=1 Tax=Trichinella spiralis TaxID=6334 RepID=A0A0V1BXU6_TRISP|nr:tRNA-dihydrouridine(20a/20b) synthase [NAD(P)+]-like [Trichinella spiralis]KRY41651.1 tRNA-dihydrouridine(20a/20b) synthase [NAD(P)+]-like [Trichinella spiralis]